MTRAKSPPRAGTKVLTIAVCATLVLALALAAAVAGGIAPFLLAAAMSVVLALGWAQAVGIRARYRHSIIILVSGILAAAVSWLPSGDQLTWAPAIVAMALIAIFLAELVRGEGSEHRLESTISSTAGVLAAVSASGWIALSQHLHDLGDTPVAMVVVPGLVTAVIIGVAGYRLLMSGPERAPKRGLLSLSVLPVALLGPTALFAGLIVAHVVI
ncbi:hypothetical protein [Kocuria palustris]|uniref:hypothetical protein n=1 Tax=Kocuria palustris TaxID=71999 RepID=UPI00119D249A|nr:hypothetical protein [Kocuria palustris]